jgi:uncharacterized membrane protein YkvA (DUF1232 family)
MSPFAAAEPRFRATLARAALAAGRDIVEKTLWLYFAAQRPETPRWAKAKVYGALAYLIVPLDAIPDVTPFAGFTDDLGVLALAVATITRYIDVAVKDQTRRVLAQWF